MSLRVLEPGLFTLVVDRGRPATRRLGVPVGGAADLGQVGTGSFPDALSPDANVLVPSMVVGWP